MENPIVNEYLKELDAEEESTRRCLERIPSELSGWKPHERSMEMGYLALLVAEIPRWISASIEDSEIDLATFIHHKPETTQELVDYFNSNMESARNALRKINDNDLENSFSLKRDGQIVFTSTKRENISQSVNHLVHHRGQLTVYMRLNDIPVPSIYGPSADERT